MELVGVNEETKARNQEVLSQMLNLNDLAENDLVLLVMGEALYTTTDPLYMV